MSRYQYQPLDPEAKTIRLMRLFPGSFEDDICVSLDNAVLLADKIPKYEALSYAWGSREDPVDISVTTHSTPGILRKGKRILETGKVVDGCLGVTQNLAVALRHLRLKEKNRVLWIDAICVDQQNLNERGHQVEKMADIYQNAGQVVAWLGPEGDSSTLAIETLGSLGSRLENDWNAQTIIPKSPEDTDLADTDIALPYDNKTWGSIQSLLSRPYYKRLWIWQELLLAESVSLQCGYRAIGWNNFRKAIHCIYMKPKPSYLTVMDHLFNFIYVEAWVYSLDALLDYTQACEFSDPRDRIYALLNIVHKGESAVGLKPDYSQRPYRVFQDVVLRYLSHTGELDLIASCEWNTDLVEKPSWVPDFSKPRISYPIRSASCCLGSRAEAEYDGNGVLQATGICVADISGIEKVPLDDKALRHTPEMGLTIRRLMDTINLDGPYLDGSNMIDALCRTLCMNQVAQSYNPPRPDCPDLETALQYLRHLSQTSPGKTEPYDRYLDYVEHYHKGRHFFTTKQGYIGLLPGAGKIGDQVCIVLGCQFPLLLRRMESGNLAVIGDCYIHGLTNGEALLGTLPHGWQRSMILTAEWGFQKGYVERETGDHMVEDPRLGELPSGWRLTDRDAPADWVNWFVNDKTAEQLLWPIDPRMTPDALRARGVPLQEFLLE